MEPTNFICTEPGLRTLYFDGFLDGELSLGDLQNFKDHLELCHKCREDVVFWQWTIRQLKTIQQ